jgi:hypothetical protein
MLGGLLVLLTTAIISFAMIDALKRRYPFIDAPLLKKLFFYHVLLFFAYYGYAVFNPSDSQFYYQKVLMDFRGENWSDFYGTSTRFIEFVGYPFIRFMGFSYEAIMALFSWFGYMGFVYFYIFFKENIRFRHSLFGYDMITLFFFLPNLHFWSASFGKGSIIFLGVGLYFYGISKIRTRWLPIILSGVIIYHVRPHIMLVVLVSSAIGFVFSSKGVSLFWRLAFLAGASIAFIYIFNDVLSMVGLEQETMFTEGLDMSHRATELAKATSGVDITNYSLPMQLFTFLYRPLFVDAPGALGIFVSFENVFYVLMTLQFFKSWRGFTYPARANFLAKSAFFSFITISIALAQVSGNLGIAMRQKSQVMILLLFVVISFLDEQKWNEWKVKQARKKKLERAKKMLTNNPT